MGAEIFANLGAILGSLSTLLATVGTGVGFLIRGRRQAKRQRLRTEAVATLAAQEAKKALEARLEAQHAEQIKTMEAQLQDLRNLHTVQIEQYKTQITDLQRDREQLLARILRDSERDHND